MIIKHIHITSITENGVTSTTSKYYQTDECGNVKADGLAPVEILGMLEFAKFGILHPLPQGEKS